MPRFQIEANGKRYEVEAPDMQTAAAATQGVLSPSQRIQGAFDAAQPVQQVDKLSEPFTGGILPISRDRLGGLHPAVPKMLQPVVSGATLPGDVYSGKVDPRSDEAIRRSADLALTASPASAAMKAGERMIPGASQALRREKPAVPTSEELRAAGSAGYDEARAMGVDYDPGAVAQMASTVRAGLEADGINPITAPKSFGLLKMLESPPPGAGASLTGIDTARKAFRHAARDFTNPTEQLAATRIIAELDRFSEAPPPSSVVAGPATAAGAVQKEARGNYAAGMRSEEFASKQGIAELSAKASNSGANIDNALRQRVRDILKSKKASAGYSKEELAAMRNFVLGSKSRNTLRAIAGVFGGGGGLAALAAGGVAGAAGGYPAALALPAFGVGTKLLQNRMARQGMESIDEALRMRSPLYQSRLANAPVNPVSPEARAAALRASLLYGLGPPPQY